MIKKISLILTVLALSSSSKVYSQNCEEINNDTFSGWLASLSLVDFKDELERCRTLAMFAKQSSELELWYQTRLISDGEFRQVSESFITPRAALQFRFTGSTLGMVSSKVVGDADTNKRKPNISTLPNFTNVP